MRNTDLTRNGGRSHAAPLPGALSITWPVADGELPDIEILQSLSAWLADLLRTTDKKILVHCVASVNRSSGRPSCSSASTIGANPARS